MKISIRTRYGCIRPEVRSLAGSRILILLRYYGLAKGHKLPNGKKLVRSQKLLPGVIFMPYWKINKKGEKERWYAIYADIYRAIRGRRHAATTYGGEGRGEVEKVFISLETAREIITTLLAYADLSDSQRKELNELIEKMEEDLARVRDENKVEAREYLASASEVVDSAGRINPGATGAKVVAAGNRLEYRLGAIMAIVPRLDFTSTVLWQEKNRLRAILRGLQHCLRAMLEHEVFHQFASVYYKTKQIDGIRARLQAEIEQLKSIDCQPFVFLRDRLIDELGAAIKKMSEGKFTAAQDLLERSVRSLVFKDKRDELEKLIADFNFRLRQEGREWTFADILHFQERLERFYSSLANLDETGFKTPVLDKVRTNLMLASEKLSAGELNETKECLKKAAVL